MIEVSGGVQHGLRTDHFDVGCDSNLESWSRVREFWFRSYIYTR